MVLSYLDRRDLEVFSRASSVGNALAGPMLFNNLTFRHHRLSVEEQLNAVLSDPARFKKVANIKFICDWV